MEKELILCRKKLEHGTVNENAFYCAEDALPCTLHMENRVGLATMNLLFVEGYGNCDNGLLCNAPGRGLPVQWKERVRVIIETINKDILGTEINPSQLSFPLTENQKEVGALRLDSNRIRSIIDELDKLIDATAMDINRKMLWKRCADNFKKAIKISQKKEDYLETKIIEFQEFIDLCAQDWLALWGEAGATDHIHVLISGHIVEHVISFGYLHRFSQ